MNFNEIQELIRMVSKHKLAEFILKEGEFKIIIRNQSASDGGAVPVVVPVQQPVVTLAPQIPAPPPAAIPAKTESAPAEAEKPAAGEDTSRYVPIKSPMV